MLRLENIERRTNLSCAKELTRERLESALGFDPQDFSGSAAAYFLLNSEEIVTARQNTAGKIVDGFLFSGDVSFSPESSDLTRAVVIFVAEAAYTASNLLPQFNHELEGFWYQIGTAIIGSEVEIFSGGMKDYSLPITSDGIFHNARRDRDLFQDQYSTALIELFSAHSNHDTYQPEQNLSVAMTPAAD